MGELRAKLGVGSALMDARAGREACGVKARPGRASKRGTKPPISDQAPPVWRVPEGPEGTGGLRDRPLRAKLACGDLAGGRARRRPEHQRRHNQHTQECRRPPAHTAARLRRTERAAPGTPAAPQPTRQPKQRKRAAAREGRRAFTQLVRTRHSRKQGVLDAVERPSTQRSRAATTSATWTALRAAPLRRLSPETTRTRPRLPSTA